MQTYTHMLVGVLLSRAFPDKPLAQGVCVLGSILPDLTMVPIFLMDKVKGNNTSSLTNKAPWLQTTVEILHSIPVVIVMLIVAYLFRSVLLGALCAGITSHIMIDTMTHTGKRFLLDDVTHVWPWPTTRKLGHEIGFWEYRNAPGDLSPKNVEIVFMIVIIFLIIGTLI